MKIEKSGLLVVDKPTGMTSFDVVRDVRRLAEMRKVGHTGTLDPDATGVLPVALGRCTKLSKFLTLDRKEYAFTLRLGEETDTGDASGEIVRKAPWETIGRADLEAVLPQFTGEIQQVPPIYSAIKVDGKRAYELARAGKDVELEARPVVVRRLEVVDWSPPEIALEVECGPGTYVRSLARDIGAALESAGHTTRIRRLAVGPFSIDDSVSLDDLNVENFWEHVTSPLKMVQSLKNYELNDREVVDVGHGRPLAVDGPWELEEAIAAHDGEGRLIAVMEWREKKDDRPRLWPRRVMI